jgi:nucleolar protein 58
MIMKWHCPGQKIAVGNPEYRKIIEERLKITCMCGPAVTELIWGIHTEIHANVPRCLQKNHS